MNMRKLVLIAALALGGGTAPALAGGLIEGTWMTPQQSQMQIATCAQGFCGTLSKIVITEEQIAQYGEAAANLQVESITDEFNKDPALKGRPMLGLQILTLRATTSPWQFEGEIYNPQDGNTYAGFVEVKDPDTVVLKGCALYVLCQEQTWTRVLLEEGELDAKVE